MQRTLRVATALFIGWFALFGAFGVQAAAGSRTTTADHSQFKELQKDFQSGPEVTQACLSCHTEAAKQVMHTQHWTWEFVNPQTQQQLGKRHVVNNYCVSAQSNFQACASCHVGYGALFDTGLKNEESRVDCLVCHATVSYSKPSGLRGDVVGRDTEFPPGSGRIIRGQNLARIAQSVGKTSRETCGKCHFMGGGGDGVKHGDLDTSLEFPDKSLDVHMNIDGLNFTCATCHMTDNHQVPGSRYAPTAVDTKGIVVPGMEKRTSCQSCHGQAPHKAGENAEKLNSHGRKIACQTCHIPAMARGGVPTMTSWDWSTAGKLDEQGKQFLERNEFGVRAYESRKGHATWAENLKPDYIWFNGEVKYTLPTDKIDPSQSPVYINRFMGSGTDGKSKIWPIKTHRGKQAFDTTHNNLVVVQVAGTNETAFWHNLDWSRAITVGMQAINQPFSGNVGFVETKSQWVINHMVAPKEDSLSCNECHTKNGRLEGIDGVYITGRDNIPWLDNGVKLLALLTLLGVLGHGLLRIVMAKKH